MISGEIEKFYNAWDKLKQNSPAMASNLYYNKFELEKIFADRDCPVFYFKNAILLFVPRHSSFYDCQFVASDPDALKDALQNFIARYPFAIPMRLSVTATEPLVSRLGDIVEQCGFEKVKKLLRLRLKRPSPRVYAAMRAFAEEYKDCMDFARPDEAAEIEAILRSEFDEMGDNLPETGEILENIRRRQVAVIRLDGKIASLHYFTVSNGIWNGYYDVTRKEYRGAAGLLFALLVFERDYFASTGIKIVRNYGWRDAANERYLKSSRQINSFPDGVVINTFLYKPDILMK